MIDQQKLADAYIFVRDTKYTLHDKVVELMRDEESCKNSKETCDARMKDVTAAITAVKTIGGDTSPYETEIEVLKKTKQGIEALLAGIELELKHTREVMKHIDLAHEGLHWAQFSESRLRNFLKEHNRNATEIQGR